MIPNASFIDHAIKTAKSRYWFESIIAPIATRWIESERGETPGDEVASRLPSRYKFQLAAIVGSGCVVPHIIRDGCGAANRDNFDRPD